MLVLVGVLVAPSLVSEDLATETESGLGGPSFASPSHGYGQGQTAPCPAGCAMCPLFYAGKGVVHAADIHEGG